MERSDGNRPGSGGSRPGSRGALGIAGASISVKESLEILQNASKSSEKALEVQKEARAAVASMKEASAKFEQTVAEAEKTCQKGSSLDEKWEEFKAKFEALNRMAVEKIMGLGGGSSSDLRPADRISVARVAQVLRRSQNLVVLTGAGISAESGIPTFRGADGFWTVGSKHYQPQELATWEKYNEMPAELWRWYQYRWDICRKAKPNPGHTSVVELQRLAEGDFMLVTQNVDGLHLQAGTDRSKLCEIHGRIDEMRCDERIEGSCLYKLDLNNIANLDRARATVMPTPEPAKDEKEECLPLCPKCGVRQRPKILWFDETYNEAFFKWNTVMEKMERCDVLLIVGTQLTTGGPRSMVRAAQKAGAIIIRVDPEVDLKDDSTAGMLHLQGKSGEVLPDLVKEVARLRKEPLMPRLAAMADLPPIPEAPSAPAAASAAPSAPSLSRTATRGTSTPAAARKSMAPRAPSPATRAPSPGMKTPSRPAASASSSSSASPPARAPSRRKGRAASDRGQIPTGFFVYGTLRPDDDSKASWTKSFNEGLEAEVAYLPGASLYIDGRYPAVCFEQTSCSVRGMLLKPAAGGSGAGLLASKLTEADQIEGHPDLYSRTVATVLTDRGVTCPAYVYHRTGKFDRTSCQRIADGDWLSRVRSGPALLP